MLETHYAALPDSTMDEYPMSTEILRAVPPNSLYTPPLFHPISYQTEESPIYLITEASFREHYDRLHASAARAHATLNVLNVSLHERERRMAQLRVTDARTARERNARDLNAPDSYWHQLRVRRTQTAERLALLETARDSFADRYLAELQALAEMLHPWYGEMVVRAQKYLEDKDLADD